jgi:hypothetical protein
MHQSVIYMPPLPATMNVDGHIDRRGIRYLGTAHRQPNGKYICLADIDGNLCRVEATITFEPSETGSETDG